MTDQQLECVQCGAEFAFTEGEQQFFASKGLTPPRRCPKCRFERKREQQRQTREQGFKGQ